MPILNQTFNTQDTPKEMIKVHNSTMTLKYGIKF